jgi:hypothetical protein
MFIDDNGTLIKRGFASEHDPSRPGIVRARQNAQGEPIVEEVAYIYTSGETEQWFAHGGVIRRDVIGNVLWTVTPGGETTRYYYSGKPALDLGRALRVAIAVARQPRHGESCRSLDQSEIRRCCVGRQGEEDADNLACGWLAPAYCWR